MNQQQDTGIRCHVPQSGYIITLNTLAKFFPDTREDVKNYCDSISDRAKEAKKRDSSYEDFGQHLQTFQAYGDFDRITFKGVNRFSRFFDLDQRSKYWLGKHQNIFLYRIIGSEGEKCRVYPYWENDKEKPEDNDFGFFINPKDGHREPFLYSALHGYAIDKKGKTNSNIFFPFFLLSQISLSNSIVTRVVDYEQFIKKMKKELQKILDKIIEQYQWNIHYEIYGSLSASELTVIWVTEQYTNVLWLMDHLRKTKFDIHGEEWRTGENDSLFFSTYSVVGRMLAYRQKGAEVHGAKIGDIKGTARIDIIANDKECVTDLYDLITNEGLLKIYPDSSFISAGEQDLSFGLPARDVYDLFTEDKINSEDNGFFKRENVREKILGIKVSLSSQTKDMKTGEFPPSRIKFSNDIVSKKDNKVTQFNELSTELDPKEERIIFEKKEGLGDGDIPAWSEGEREQVYSASLRKLYLTIRKELKNRFDSHSGSVDTLDMLYTDYLSNIHDSYNVLWRNDYHYQFKKSLIYLLYIVRNRQAINDDISGREEMSFWSEFTLTIDNIRQQTQHFSQSNRLVVRIPASHLRYTASADAMLHCYYGMAKSILQYAYAAQENGQFQSELLPVITTNSTPFITSRLYKAGQHCNDLRIMQIDIPYSLLFDPIEGLPYLTHELFHYMAPRSRRKRNEAICKIIINEALTYIYLFQIEHDLKRRLYEMGRDKESSEAFENTGLKIDSLMDSFNSHAFVKAFNRYMQGKLPKSDNSGDSLEYLHRSLAAVMWNDVQIKKLRDEIVQEVLLLCEDEDKATWDLAIDTIFRHLGELSVLTKTLISGRLLQHMTETDYLWDEINKTDDWEQKIKLQEDFEELLFIDHTFIGALPILKGEGVGVVYETKSTLNNILYRYRVSMLNPNTLESAGLKSRIYFTVLDNLIKGLQEATPDMAMVSFCNMDQIDYLVTHARLMHDNGYVKKPRYSVVRLMTVIAWLEGITDIHQVDGGRKILKSFDFEKNPYEFVKRYIAEYLPQIPGEGKLIKIIADAIHWFDYYLQIADSFKNTYGIYLEVLNELKETYVQYFSPLDEETKHISSPLVESIEKRRLLKKDRRYKILTDQQDEQIKKLTEYLFNNMETLEREVYKNGTISIDMVEGCVKERFTAPDREEYKEEHSRYNAEAFEETLQFIHISSRQPTFKMLSNGIKRLGSPDPEDLAKTQVTEGSGNGVSQQNAIDNLIDEVTVSKAWGATEFAYLLDDYRGLLRKGDSGIAIWYKAIGERSKLVPTALSETGDGTEKRKTIFTGISRDLNNYLAEQVGKLQSVKMAESIAYMTVNSPEKRSNLILWKGKVSLCLSELYRDAKLYLFSPEKYIAARNTLMRHNDAPNPDSKEGMSTGNNSIPIIFGDGNIGMDYPLYLYGTGTDAEVNKSEVPMEGEKTINNIEDILGILPIPFTMVDLEDNCRFLAYRFDTPYSYRNSEKISLEVIQKMFISNLINKSVTQDDPKEKMKEIILENAFLYRIDLSQDILEQFGHMIN